MKLVRIISGTYGHKPKGAPSVKTIRIDETVELPDTEAARLVQLRVAAYVDTPAVVPVDPDTDMLPSGISTSSGDEDDLSPGDTPDEDENGAEGEESGEQPVGEAPPAADSTESNNTIPEYNAEMPLVILKEILKDCGLPFKFGMSKLDVVQVLDDYFADAEDDEAPPSLDTEDPVT